MICATSTIFCRCGDTKRLAEGADGSLRCTRPWVSGRSREPPARLPRRSKLLLQAFLVEALSKALELLEIGRQRLLNVRRIGRQVHRKRVAEVAKTTKKQFGDPWGLIAMDLATEQRASAGVRFTGDVVTYYEEREQAEGAPG